MFLIREAHRVMIIVCPVIFFMGCINRADVNEKQQADERIVFEHAQQYIEQEAFDKAYKLYNYFVQRYPNHPLADDAAYRLCYIHVFDSDKNNYFNYADALKQFQKFIETYKNSRYISACKNWIAVLNHVKKRGQVVTDVPVLDNPARPEERETMSSR